MIPVRRPPRNGLALPYPFNLLLALACSLVSHFLVERKVLRWRKRQRAVAAPAPVGVSV